MVRDAQCVRASDEFQMITLPEDSGVTRSVLAGRVIPAKHGDDVT